MTELAAIKRQLIALNTGEHLARDSICRLSIRAREWVSSDESTPVLSSRFGVPTADMAEARRLILRSEKLADRELTLAKRSSTKILTLHDSSYPSTLLDLDLPPPVLYCRGRIPSSPAVAIVGSRQASPRGLDAAELFGRELAACGLTVVSGFARGIDLAAHRGALSTVSGGTVAVLGCGLDVDYPTGRRRIRSLLPTRGALISEFSFGSQPRSWNFPVRNRVIAALALGVLVVEGTPRSGSLITARLALDLGRDVYAVPGSIFDRGSAGPNRLIQDGALLATHPQEIVDSLPISIRDSLEEISDGSPRPRLGGPQGELLIALAPGQRVTAEQLATTTKKPLDEVLGLLLQLEINGLVARFPGPAFCRKP